MKKELENMTKQELIHQLLTLQTSNQKLETSNQRKDLIIANLQRMLFGSKKERFIGEDKAQLLFSFEEFASEEAANDQTPVKEKISYERQKPSKHTGRNKLPDTLDVVEEIIEPEDVTEDMNIRQPNFSSAELSVPNTSINRPKKSKSLNFRPDPSKNAWQETPF
jgi:hypothetical protein